MAGLTDFLSLLATLAVFGGLIYGVIFVVKTVNEGVASTKESLKAKGLHVTSSGMSVKTDKRFDREDYVDATQRGIMNAMNAASFRKGGAAMPNAPAMDRTASSASMKSNKSGSDSGSKRRH
ncbi:hypothetical protein D9619_008527 [Psilocybe cf. subviscida]|uniref:Uncharacterized protein n=1 Tax=Psilocybe cf. subviscida TaxID=2480587 RepID=A0A8H5F131_9AGAR|nr:hypothetical protein D9619_008527 [Psilocybe cf. subviscida]